MVQVTNLGARSESFWEEPNKAESAKLPGAGIAPKPCPRKWAGEEEKGEERRATINGLTTMPNVCVIL